MTRRLLIIALFASSTVAPAQDAGLLYLGADLSYVNEMEDCGGTYRADGVARDPFELFAERGANLIRVRLWHAPSWTNYSTFADARKTISRAKAEGMSTLLDFHYSDDWADPGSQNPPDAWQGLSIDVLEDSLYAYTYRVIADLAAEGLTPEMVQIGNEINPGMLLPHGSTSNWSQLGALLNAGIRAVRDAATASGQTIKVMLHVAQPENVHGWIADAIDRGGVNDFDVIGISYYKAWSSVPLHHIADYVSRLRTAFEREVLVAETGYPWTYSSHDGANNLLGVDAIEIGYAITPDGQSRYVHDLMQTVLDGGGSGIVYWEPAWISTGCWTQWGQGSHWENVAFFDFENGNEVLPAIDFMGAAYAAPRTVPVQLRVKTTGYDVAGGVYVAGDMTYDASGDWQAQQMISQTDDWYAASFDLRVNAAYRFSFYNGPNLAQSKEPLPVQCAGDGGENRLVAVSDSIGTLEFDFGTCAGEDLVDVTLQVDMTGQSGPNGVFVAGDLTKNTADQWTFRRLDPVGGNLFATTLALARGGRYPFAFYTGTTWASDEKESIPHPCATAWGTHRTLEVPLEERVVRYRFGNCLVTDATAVDPEEEPHASSVLQTHYPNPASGRTTFVYELSQPAHVRLSVFDILGREVAVVDEGQRFTARYEVVFDTRSLPSGIYVYRLIAGNSTATRSLIIL